MATTNALEQMPRVEANVYLSASPETVWAYMADLPFVRALPFTTMEVIGEPVNVGTINRLTIALPLGLTFRFDELVTEWEPHKRIAYRAISGWKMEAWAVMCPEDGGTRFQFILQYRAPGLWKLIPRWLIRLGCKQGLNNLRNMIKVKPSNSVVNL